MKIKKKQIPARILCENGILIKGIVHLLEGERVLDFANDAKRKFIPVTKVELYYAQGPDFIKITSDLLARKDLIILNKETIRWIEEE